MVKLTAAEYQACWQERIEKEDRAFLEATLKDHGDKASKLQSSEVGSQLGSKLDAGPSPGSVLGSAIGSQLGSDKRSSLSGATESIISSHVSSASVSMRKIELLKKQLEQEKQKRLDIEMQLARAGRVPPMPSEVTRKVAEKAFK
mmetsp:Transcript_7460/g.23084  ORF Transcript_7460/g.23084 Transcript_7460/m.23084 type:complete len:145 (-) Transcript_7460:158-592(-)